MDVLFIESLVVLFPDLYVVLLSLNKFPPIGYVYFFFFFFQAEDGIRDIGVTGVQTCALPISSPTIASRPRAVVAEETKKAADALQTLAAAAAAAAATPASPPPPPACDNDGTPDALDPSDDNDGLDDKRENEIKTDPCNVDTDGDGLEDGWEYRSAYDLNRPSCDNPDPYPSPCNAITPAKYPVKKPYPNPLDGSDANTDFDGDWLTAAHEHAAWKRRVGSTRDVLGGPLWYSDGLQASINTAGKSNCRGMPVPANLFDDARYPLSAGSPYRVYTLDRFGRDAYDGCLNDGERDEDGDWLSNRDEVFNALSGPEWWAAVYKEPAYRVIWEGTDWLDWDTDGDDTPDSKDDQDDDDFWNIEETNRGAQSVDKESNLMRTGETSGLWVDAFNTGLWSVTSTIWPP